jgi:hypothetical protein
MSAKTPAPAIALRVAVAAPGAVRRLGRGGGRRSDWQGGEAVAPRATNGDGGSNHGPTPRRKPRRRPSSRSPPHRFPSILISAAVVLSQIPKWRLEA